MSSLPSRLPRRRALKLLAFGSSAALLAACSAPGAPSAATSAPPAPATSAPPAPATSAPPAAATSAPPAPATSAPPAAAAATTAGASAAPTAGSVAAAQTPVLPTAVAQPRTGGTLRAGMATDISGLEPHFSLSWTTSETTWLPYDRLTAYDLNLTPQPMLAESWDLSDDYKQIKLNLRHGVQWHDGRELTSDDIKYTFARILDPKVGNGQFTTQSKWFTSVATPDKYTAILTSDLPRPTMFDFFEYLNIVDKNTLEGPDAQTTVNGTGPFIFEEWVQGDHISFVKNKNYWKSGRPYLDRVVNSFIKDPQSLVAQFEAGALDTVSIPPRLDFVRLQTDPKYQGITHPNGGSWYLAYYNTTVPPFDNKLVRQAMNYAIDRQRFVDTVLLGVGTAQDLPWTPGSPAYEPDKNARYTFDLDRARALLAQAGVSSISADIVPLPSLPESPVFAQLYQGDLAKIGVTLNVITVDLATWADQVNNRKYRGMAWAQQSTGSTNLSPANLYIAGRANNPTSNNSGFKDDTYTNLVNAASVETDPQKTKQLYSQLNDIVLEESFIAPMSPNVLTKLARQGVHDITPNMHNGWLYTDAWLGA